MTTPPFKSPEPPESPEERDTEIDVRVRYTECDPMGVAHHSVYAIWMEIARTELLRRVGVAYRDLEERGVFFVVVGLSIRFRRPARYDDLLRVAVRQTPAPDGRRVKVEHQYKIFRGQELLATAETTLACIDRAGKPQPIPDGTLGPA